MIRRWLRGCFTVVLAALVVVGALVIPSSAAAHQASHAQRRCTRSISTSANQFSVVVTVHQSCGISHRAWLESTDGKTHYGAYTKLNGHTSTACVNVQTCGGGVGTVIDGGWQRKDTGFRKCTVGCVATVTLAHGCQHVLWTAGDVNRPAVLCYGLKRPPAGEEWDLVFDGTTSFTVHRGTVVEAFLFTPGAK